uniref:Cilia- and flagella-associated protein 43 n=1 Tax=Sparus aurata TaxID=8175 RepID=A0A671WDX3_SPAAU
KLNSQEFLVTAEHQQPVFPIFYFYYGTAQLDYTSLTLSDGGPYLGSCSSLPDHTITVWNWETTEPICTQPQAGQDVVSLVFNPLNWLHRLGSKVTPTAICWTATSELYVGCAEGFLLLVEPESLSVSVLFNPTIALLSGFLNHSNVKALQNPCVLQGNVMHCLQIKQTQINITQTWQLQGSVTAVMNSPDRETLILSSNTVSIHTKKTPKQQTCYFIK